MTGSRVLVPAAALALLLLASGQASWIPAPQSASAEPKGEPLVSNPFNSTEDRKAIIDQLRMINERLARLETKLSQPLEVNVKTMPPIVLPSTPSTPPASGAK
jgi:hypothetical protein